jgi:hypothetical protein
MKLFEWSKDGGPDSHVDGFFIVEIKPLFSIVLLHFGKGSREAYHSHAFNAFTIWLSGAVIEHFPSLALPLPWSAGQTKYTPRNLMHKVEGVENAWALSFRGPWKNTWKEYLPEENKYVTLTHGRQIVTS